MHSRRDFLLGLGASSAALRGLPSVLQATLAATVTGTATGLVGCATRHTQASATSQLAQASLVHELAELKAAVAAIAQATGAGSAMLAQHHRLVQLQDVLGADELLEVGTALTIRSNSRSITISELTRPALREAVSTLLGATWRPGAAAQLPWVPLGPPPPNQLTPIYDALVARLPSRIVYQACTRIQHAEQRLHVTPQRVHTEQRRRALMQATVAARLGDRLMFATQAWRPPAQGASNQAPPSSNLDFEPLLQDALRRPTPTPFAAQQTTVFIDGALVASLLASVATQSPAPPHPFDFNVRGNAWHRTISLDATNRAPAVGQLSPGAAQPAGSHYLTGGHVLHSQSGAVAITPAWCMPLQDGAFTGHSYPAVMATTTLAAFAQAIPSGPPRLHVVDETTDVVCTGVAVPVELWP